MTREENEKLAELLFPAITTTPEDMEKRYPPRNLPEGAAVTRFAPSPTGFIHFGGMFPTRVSERLAHQSNGVLFLRIEDTDSKREVKGATANLIDTLAHYGVVFDEGATAEGDKGDYGPYVQSKRANIYQTFAKQLVREGKAYPCFTSEEELEQLHSQDKKAELKERDWSDFEEIRDEEQKKSRSITFEEASEAVAAGKPFVLRILSDGDPEKKTKFTDLIKGEIEIPENCEDFVLLKSDGIPTYHFAHAVDDHLMRTTHVVRGEEWLPSLPKHIQLFRYLGFKLPKFLHISQLMKLENGSKKKLSKRDAGVDMNYYREKGYAPETVVEYVMTLLNSNYEDWRRANPDSSFTEFPFSVKKMSASGCLFDQDKLNDVSKNTVSRMTAEQVYTDVLDWADEYDKPFAEKLRANADMSKQILSIGRGGKKPRKDICIWSEVRDYMGFFFDEFFEPEYEYPQNINNDDLVSILNDYEFSGADQTEWYNDLKSFTEAHGFTSDMKAYKENPDAFKGNVGDIAMVLRVAVTGKQVSPDTYAVMNILGKEKVRERLDRALTELKENK